MKRLIALLLCVFGLLTAPLRADVELSFDFYYDQLSTMGEWVEVDGYGYVWHPNGVDEDWAPYTDGYWTYTDAGWTWVSYEEWGAICYHYGRWVNLLDYGWCWVPGYEWGPAWVSWRSSDDYIGWAPLPPECDWEPDRGVSVWVDTHYDIGPRWYSFCRIRDFGAPVIRHVCLPRIRNFEICFSTVNITNISYNRGYGCVFNGGLDYDYIRSRADRHVPALKLVQNTTNIFINNNRGNVFVNSPRGNALVVAAPRVAVNAKQFTRKPAVRRTFDRNAVARGWNGVDKPETRDRLVSKMRAETKGLTPANAKARPVKDEALAVVPKEVKLDAPTPGMQRLPAQRGNRQTAKEAAGERLTPAEREKMRNNGRGETAEAPPEGEAGKTKGRDPVAGAENRAGGLRKRPHGEAGESAELERPVATVPGAETQGPAEKRENNAGKPDRVTTPENRPDNRIPGRVAEQEDRSNDKAEKAARTAEMREAQENARRQTQESAESAARARQENSTRENAAREAAQRQANQREQAGAAQAAAERAQRQREAAANAGRAAEMNREAQENASRENAAREQAAQAAAARRAQMEAQQAAQNRPSEQAEAVQRQAAQRAENARRAAAEQQNENARRQMLERQNEARQLGAQRQAEAQRERAAAQQNEARQHAAEVMRERAGNAQREQAAENARARAMENQQRAASAAQAQAQARAEAQQQQQQAQHQQRAAAAAAQAAARQQSESRSSQQDSDDRRKRR